jgi:hypothetical protein
MRRKENFPEVEECYKHLSAFSAFSVLPALAKHVIGDYFRFFEGNSNFLTPKFPFVALKTI